MKIIGRSNFDSDTVSGILIAENVNEYYGKIILSALEEKVTEHSIYYPFIVEDSYVLYRWEP